MALTFKNLHQTIQSLQHRIDEQEHDNTSRIASDSSQEVSAENESYAKNVFGHESSEDSNSLKVLGVQWNYKDDKVICDIEHICKLAQNLEPNKRNVVGLATRFYDPFGLLSYLTVQFKILFQANITCCSNQPHCTTTTTKKSSTVLKCAVCDANVAY